VGVVAGVAVVGFKGAVFVLTGSHIPMTTAALPFVQIVHKAFSRGRMRIVTGEASRFCPGGTVLASLLFMVAGGAEFRNFFHQHFGPGPGVDLMAVGTVA
jgi:hypothetical protein